LDGWLAEAAYCEVVEVATLAAELQRERVEPPAALEPPWSTGPVEGRIIRRKLVER
jgi:transposase